MVSQSVDVRSTSYSAKIATKMQLGLDSLQYIQRDRFHSYLDAFREGHYVLLVVEGHVLCLSSTPQEKVTYTMTGDLLG